MTTQTLRKDTIDRKIRDYVARVATNKLPTLDPRRCLAFFHDLKRRPISGGPSRGLTVVEAANRTLSDLVVLGAARRLLCAPPSCLERPVDEVVVSLGNSDGFDLSARVPGGGGTLLGECFNVARSYFPMKKAQSRAKLKATNASLLILAFNSDAIDKVPVPRDRRWVYLPIDVDEVIKT
jgi:hypothetical protein